MCETFLSAVLLLCSSTFCQQHSCRFVALLSASSIIANVCNLFCQQCYRCAALLSVNSTVADVEPYFLSATLLPMCVTLFSVSSTAAAVYSTTLSAVLLPMWSYFPSSVPLLICSSTLCKQCCCQCVEHYFLSAELLIMCSSTFCPHCCCRCEQCVRWGTGSCASIAACCVRRSPSGCGPAPGLSRCTTGAHSSL